MAKLIFIKVSIVLFVISAFRQATSQNDAHAYYEYAVDNGGNGNYAFEASDGDGPTDSTVAASAFEHEKNTDDVLPDHAPIFHLMTPVSPDPVEVDGRTLEQRVSELEETARNLQGSNDSNLIDWEIEQIELLDEKRKEQGKRVESEVQLLLVRVRSLKGKLNEIESDLEGLRDEASGIPGSSPTSDFGSGSGSSGPRYSFEGPVGGEGFYNSRAKLYSSGRHSGRTEDVDFRNCRRGQNCCINLRTLDNDSGSINTFDSCVEIFIDQDCTGESRQHTRSDNGRFTERFTNSITSAKPCD